MKYVAGRVAGERKRVRGNEGVEDGVEDEGAVVSRSVTESCSEDQLLSR